MKFFCAALKGKEKVGVDVNSPGVALRVNHLLPGTANPTPRDPD